MKKKLETYFKGFIMSKKPKTIFTFLIPVLRRASMRWPNKIAARKRAKTVIENGTFKNGKTIFKVMYKCENLECGKIVDIDGGHIDHKAPVVKLDGFTTWDDYINSLFCDISNLWHLCIDCHSNKTIAENTQRTINKSAKRVMKTHSKTLKKLSKISNLRKSKTNKKKRLTKAKK